MTLDIHTETIAANQVTAKLALRQLDIPPNMTFLDVLVRELVQNALDAKKGISVAVDFRGRRATQAQSSAWQAALGAPGTPWPKWFAKSMGRQWSLLRVKDEGTWGLTGGTGLDAQQQAIESGGENGLSQAQQLRFHRLAFRYGAPNPSELAGGSWGLGGKTIVFRVEPSLGLAAYYSTPAGGEPSRLIICHCHEHDPSTPLYRISPSGFVWWGLKQRRPGRGSTETFGAITGPAADALAESLGFDVDQDWRGTQVIIPVRDDNVRRLLQPHLVEEGVRGEDSDEEDGPSVGAADYLDIDAVWFHLMTSLRDIALRWYWPRLTCRVHEGLQVKSDVGFSFTHWDTQQGAWRSQQANSRSLVDSVSVPLYSLFSRLYLSTISNENANEDGFEVDDIVASRFGGCNLGTLALHRKALPDMEEKALIKQLRREAPFLGFERIFDRREWIVAHVRDAGMVVSYRLMGSMCSSGGRELLPSSASEPIPIAIARVHGDVRVPRSADSEQSIELERIFRHAEDATHSNWSAQRLKEAAGVVGPWGKNQLSIFHKRVVEMIAPQAGAGTISVIDGDLSTMARISAGLARRLMPAGFGPGPGIPVGTGVGKRIDGVVQAGTKKGSSSNHSHGDRWSAALVGVRFVQGTTYNVDVDIVTGQEDKFAFDLCVCDEDGMITAKNWAASTSEDFPIRVEGVESIRTSKDEPCCNVRQVRIDGATVLISQKAPRRSGSVTFKVNIVGNCILDVASSGVTALRFLE